MLHLKNSVTNKKPKKTMGFSLIELLVVVGIIGILAAVAIPAYNQYRENAARGAFDATGTNVVRAFQACISVNPFASCDTIGELDINLAAYMANDNKTAPNFCVDLTDDIGGEVFKGCYSINASTSAVDTSFNKSLCHDEVTTPCTNAMGTVVATPTIGTWDGGGACETVATPQTTCTATTDCTSAGIGTICDTSGETGTCDADGTCS